MLGASAAFSVLQILCVHVDGRSTRSFELGLRCKL